MSREPAYGLVRILLHRKLVIGCIVPPFQLALRLTLSVLDSSSAERE